MTGLGLAARFAHLACGLALFGVWSALLLARGRDRPPPPARGPRRGALAAWLVGGTLLSGLVVLAQQSAVVAGRAEALLEPAVWWRLVAHSRFGAVWAVRHGLLLLLAALFLLRERPRSKADIIAWRAEGAAVSAAVAAALAWAGHAAAVESWGRIAILGDALHLLAAAAWLGALLPLALLLRAASDASGADARPYAVLAIRRFSSVALALMLVVVTTGLGNAAAQVAGVPALVGTRYGRLLMLKIAILVPIAALALANRRRLLPALSGDGATVGRPAMARLSRFLGCELGLAVAILAMTAALSLTAPARHESPWWPFSVRLSYEAVAGVPGVSSRLFAGSQLAFLGLVAAIVGRLIRRTFLVAVGALAFGAALWIALPSLAVDAYPTTYQRSPVPYQASSIARGIELYAARCAECHGPRGKGDGPGGAGLPTLPADLTAAHTAQHTAGDLFWWIGNGIPRSGMPPFGGVLSDDDRWDLVNFLRALSTGTEAGALGPVVAPLSPRLVAPDFSYAVGPTPARTLRDFRDRRIVVLVLFSLPASRQRLAQLAQHYASIQIRGGEILAVPLGGGDEIIRRLGGDPPILFPVATEGDADVDRTYRLFAAAATPAGLAHAEFLIDRQGYLRARWRPSDSGPGWSDLRVLANQLDTLNAEVPAAQAPDDHVH